ncbi:DUF1203 domain-containing protein [Streptomyces clavuligerus]|nr:DUF1203 domain-containing protein [Streptomyces clavuligerus]ANW20195.1 hypothetical protein BB341_19240 [Streptomyces clavuligerus]AXU14821.1 DUF1203 domain-containing protein [Streptomyces clavuligerus]MBY6304855.1 DUF1203 domain-containing protein [Streptomyces clavuligerus]QCS07592.1 DUF1203 domain-containing protein [Streptomyces clavuligerus]QPJ93064.1 DUF1203 domain-containing protein [Streptomyces clavuligerus]
MILTPPRRAARPIAPQTLAALRTADDAGRPARPYTVTEDGAPLRCCLRAARAGESIALVSYAPLRRWAAERGVRPGAYDEQGPVFIHGRECGGPAAPESGGAGGGYPFVRPGVLRTLRRYGADGRITGGRLLEFPEDPAPAVDRALDEAFADPGVALVHLRAVEYGCFLFEVRRP